MARTSQAPVFDGLAIGLSGLCLLHCLLLPVAVATLPALTVFVGEGVHLAMILLAVPLSVLALVSHGGWRRCGVVLLAFLGLGLMGAPLLAEFIPFTLTLPDAGVTVTQAGVAEQETSLTVVGASLLAGAHILNWRLGRKA
ncbi:MAG: MerC domain-containing protein [Asticcacaulis sp.]